MAWVKLDDGYFRHPTVLRAGRDARDLHMACLLYLAGQGGGRFIPDQAMSHIANVAGVADWVSAVERAVIVKLLHDTGDVGKGFLISDEVAWRIESDQAELNRLRATARRDSAAMVFQRDAFCCVRCGASDDLTLDHVIALSRGGTNDIDNLQTLCRPCNSRKGAR
jgi:hypothetical protein